MNVTRRKFLAFGMTTTALSSSGCGYFLYPERVGQTDGDLDPTVVILDVLGLLLGVIPGLVAFAVDLSTGAIYLPPGGKSAIDKHRDRSAAFDGLPLAPVHDLELPLDREDTAQKLSDTIGIPIEAAAIEFYRVTKHPTKLAMIATA